LKYLNVIFTFLSLTTITNVNVFHNLTLITQ